MLETCCVAGSCLPQCNTAWSNTLMSVTTSSPGRTAAEDTTPAPPCQGSKWLCWDNRGYDAHRRISAAVSSQGLLWTRLQQAALQDCTSCACSLPTPLQRGFLQPQA